MTYNIIYQYYYSISFIHSSGIMTNNVIYQQKNIGPKRNGTPLHNTMLIYQLCRSYILLLFRKLFIYHQFFIHWFFV